MAIMVGAYDPMAAQLFRGLGIADIRRVDHHLAHAATAFYQSPFKRSLIISYDGGGNDGTFRMFTGCREEGITPLSVDFPLNLGIPYRALGSPIADIRKPDDGRELSNAGKLMGLAAYGSVRPEWIPHFVAYYHGCSKGVVAPHQMYRWVLSHLGNLSEHIGISLERNALRQADAFDFARTGQHVFEMLFLERVLPAIQQWALPVCISGGCALNVLANQRLSEMIEVPVFVPPNPNDCGLALGGVLLSTRPSMPVDVTYSGPRAFDRSRLPEIVAAWNATCIGTPKVAQLLSRGAVVAVMRDRSEHGPRALGNRSILCDPGVPGMKDRLNERIKFRESFRPYAAVVRDDDAATYFTNTSQNDMSFMSFNPTVRPEWKSAFASAMHIDGTSRAQAVSRDQNRWLYDLVSDFSRLTGYGALLNTSFNTKGKPMVNTIAEALELFGSTELDHLVIDDWLFSKAKH